MLVYKFTDENMQTYNGCQWELNIPKETDGLGNLCSEHFLHFFHHPLIAAIMYHKFVLKYPRLFEAEADGIILNDGYLKGGCSKLTLTKEIELPQFTLNQRIACAILFTQQVYKNKQWNTWAKNWLNGKDRTKKSAIHARTRRALIVYYTIAAAAAYNVANAAANRAASADAVVRDTAWSIHHAIEANPDTFTFDNILNTINKALEY